jgi:predicted RND superfamily exporter protein
VLATGLQPSAATTSFVGRSSAGYRATQTFYRQFGEEPIEVLVQGELEQLLLGEDVGRLAGLEGCLSGRVPASALAREGGAAGPCGRIAALHAVQVAIGPGTFINEAAEEIDQQLALTQRQAYAQAQSARAEVYRAALARGESPAAARRLSEEARKAMLASYAAELAALGARYGIASPPTLGNPEFVNALVFDRAAPAGTPKRRFAYLFPSPDAALISVRLRAGLPEATRTRAIALIEDAVRMPQWRLRGGRYVVTGEPVIVSQLTGALRGSIELLLAAVLAVMACLLGLVFASRPVLLPLGIALVSCALTFGALALAGGALTLGTLAVLPALVGLAVDYAVQLQSRTRELIAGSSADAARAVRAAARTGAPAIAAAALACACAMLALLLSPVPLVQGFGVLLAAGVAIAFACALTLCSAALALPGLRRFPLGIHLSRRVRSLAGARWGRAALQELAAAWRGARELVRGSALAPLTMRAALSAARRAPRKALALGVALAALGWGLSALTPVQSDITKLVPRNLSALQNLRLLERETGVGGQIDLLVSAHDLATPRVVSWMSSYESAVLARFGGASRPGASSGGASSGGACAHAELCPAFSLPDLFEGAAASASGAGAAGASHPSQTEIDALLGVVPRYFSQSVISADRRYATLAFGIRLMPLNRQQRVIEAMRAMLHPPSGVSAQLVGLAVLAAHADAQVASPARRLLTVLLSIAIVAAVLFALFRGDARRTLVIVLAVALASGWSELVLFASQVPLNPMSASLSVLVVAISTELSVLLAERYREQRLAGRGRFDALRLAYERTGAALAVSGVTATGGFAVLALSRIRMLQDFGLVTLIDLVVSLLGVLISLPSLLIALGAEPVPARRERAARLSCDESGSPATPHAHAPALAAGTGAPGSEQPG